MMINTSTLVRVKPQSYGVEKYNTWQQLQIRNLFGMPGYGYILQPIDENGYVVMPMGILMAIFGPFMALHRERPFDESSIEILN